MSGRARSVLLAFLTLVAACSGAGSARAETLESLLATLHRAQDALVLEGKSARPVHDRLLQLLDERLAQPRDDRATGSIVLYALSGGDPRVAVRALSTVRQTARDAILVRGVLAYVSGRNEEAGRLLALIRPGRLRGRLASLVAMAQAGTVLRARDSEAARQGWAHVRLEAPGTLLEEASTRRLIALALERKDPENFFRLLRHYWVRFPRSAFRGRVVAAMNEGVASFEEHVILGQLPQLAGVLPDGVRSDLYAHVARTALVAGHARLATVAARRKSARLSPHRARLLKDLARLAGPNVAQVRRRLAAMPVAPLPVGDRDLLLAARAVATATLAPLEEIPPGTTLAGDLTARHRKALDAADALLVSR